MGGCFLNIIIFPYKIKAMIYTYICMYVVFTFFQKKGRVGMIKKGTFVGQKGAFVSQKGTFVSQKGTLIR